MQCNNCGGTLAYLDGLYICNSCGSRYSVTDYYEDIDVYICYVEVDKAGRRTKDSVLAQNIYRTLESAKIKTFYARISADNLTGNSLEKACIAAIHSAKAVLILGTQKQYFDLLIETYSAFYTGKIIIPVYADMNAYDIPKGISAIQALDYNKIGASVDLTKGVCNALGRKQELSYAALTRKSGNKRKTTLWTIVAALVIAVLILGTYFVSGNHLGIRKNDEIPATTETTPPIAETTLPTVETTHPVLETTQPTLSLEEIQENQYSEAVACADSGDYAKAIELFSRLSGYKDSDKRLSLIYQYYAGYYQSKTEEITFRLQVWDGNVGAIELSQITPNGEYCRITETFQLQGSFQSFDFNDSENNQGQIALTLTSSKIVVALRTTSTSSDIFIDSVKVEFLLEEKSDKPFAAQINEETLLSWVNNRTTLGQLKQRGFEVVFESTIEEMPYDIYKIKNTDISFVVTTLDYSMDTAASDPVVVAVAAPASVIIPDKIGEANDAFIKDEVLFVPDGVFAGDVGTGFFFGFLEEIEARNISGDTSVCFTSEVAIGPDFEWLIQMYIEKVSIW